MNRGDDYFPEARTWAADRMETAARERRIAWRIAISAGVVTLLLVLALVLLIPLKTVEPYVFTVDRQTGTVEAVTTVAGGRLSQNEAVVQAQLAGYVIARETFDATDLGVQYRRVQLLSSPNVARAYVSDMATTNPASRLRTLGPGDTVAVAIRSVSLIGDGVGLVRFTATQTSPSSVRGSSANFVSGISFGFSGRPLRTADRYDNPLGFQVLRYRRDADGVP